MTRLVFNHDHRLLPRLSADVLPVQLYGLGTHTRNDISVIGNPIVEKLKRLGIPLAPQVMDFLTIALAVTAADTFVQRERADDGWARDLCLQLPLYEPDRWEPLKQDLQETLHFLSGDIWRFEFEDDGYAPPPPYRSRDGFHLLRSRGLDCICLFSGGLDSAIGAIDLLAQNRSPLLVSHAYKGDKTHQEHIAANLSGRFSRFEVNADPHRYTEPTEITMRTRSFNFLAFAAVGAYVIQAVNQLPSIDLIVPENGFISLNAPLTSRRVGALSTRTTHPYFLRKVQSLFSSAGIPGLISNPYQFKTKGEMAIECLNRHLLEKIVDRTVSCSHWKRSNQQCGVCVPCIIRRAALNAGGIRENMSYAFDDVSAVLTDQDRRDDLMALALALLQRTTRNIKSWIADSGPLPSSNLADYQSVFSNGMDEVEVFLKYEGVL